MSENDHSIEIENHEPPISHLSIFNNEAIGCLAMYSVIRELKTISPAKALLILPLALQNELISYVGRSNTDVRSIEQLLVRKPDVLSNFNERFYSLIKTTMNSLLILNAIGCISFDSNGRINIVEGKSFLPSTEEKEIGKRGNKIINSSSKIAKLLDDEVSKLYLQLRVRL